MLGRLLFVIAAVLVTAALRATYPVTMPLAVALVVVAAVWPIKQWLEGFLPRWASYGGTVVALLVVSALFVGGVWFSATHVVSVFARNKARFEEIYESLSTWRERLGIDDIGGPQTYSELLGLAQTVLTNTYTLLVYLGFILLLVILALPEVSYVRRRLAETLDREERLAMVAAIDEIGLKVRRYLGTTFLTSIITGVASAVWSFAVGLELALVWGVLNFLLNFVPLIGNVVGVVPPTLYAVVQFQNASMPLLVLAGFLVLHIVISNFIYPALQGQSLSLSPFAIVVALAFWTWMWGFAGALLAVPLTAACVIAADHFAGTRWIARVLTR
ncbi:MAG: AI-2E family transporter [Enhydrobacter sp.]|nr:AI-2E family transporter [Enhydrobacter sp.]